MSLLMVMVESLADAPGAGIDGGSSVAGSGAGMCGGSPSSETPDEPWEKMYTTEFLHNYGDWLKKGSPAERAAKASTGIFVLPLAAYALVGEDSLAYLGIKRGCGWFGMGGHP